MGEVKYIPIHNWDNSIASAIKSKMNEVGGETTIKSGISQYKISYANDESGICFENAKGTQKELPWEAFFATVDVLKANNGKAVKGNATNAKLGSEELPINSVEGYVASTVFKRENNQTVEKNVSEIATLLDWADIAKNGRGYMELK